MIKRLNSNIHRRLRMQYILYSLVPILSVIVIITLFIDISVSIRIYHRVDNRIDYLYELLHPYFSREQNRVYEWYGYWPSEKNLNSDSDTSSQTDSTWQRRNITFFVIRKPVDSDIVEDDLRSIPNVSYEEASELSNYALRRGFSTGSVGKYRYKTYHNDKGDTAVIFLNIENSISYIHNMIQTSMLVSVVGFCIATVSAIIISKRAANKTADSIYRHRQLITNATHDLKTPISIIKANMDVLTLKDQNNQWIISTKNQINRLNKLVNDLMEVSKLGEDGIDIQFEQFDLSTAISESTEPFIKVLESRGISYKQDIDPDVVYYGSEIFIRRLIIILCENAAKYTNDNGKIKLNMSCDKSNHIITISIVNTCYSIENIEADRVFDRFYRGDKSRSQEIGGNGIGLAIAKAIVEAHNGNIYAQCTPAGSANTAYSSDSVGTIEFTVKLKAGTRK